MLKIDFLRPDPQDWNKLGQIAGIDRQAFAEDGISVFNLAQFTRSGSVYCLVDSNQVVAETVILRNLHDSGAVVFGFAVDEKRNGQGLGGIMMQKLIGVAREFGITYLELTMNPENPAAKRLYMEKSGFEKKQELLPHPMKNEPRWLMRLDLANR